MATTKEEWAALYGRILATWPKTDWPPETLHVYYEALYRYEPQDVAVAIRQLGTRLEQAPTLSRLLEFTREAAAERARRSDKIEPPVVMGDAAVKEMDYAVRTWWRETIREALASEDPGRALVAARRRAVTLFGEKDWYDDEVAWQANPRRPGVVGSGDAETPAAGPDA